MPDATAPDRFEDARQPDVSPDRESRGLISDQRRLPEKQLVAIDGDFELPPSATGPVDWRGPLL